MYPLFVLNPILWRPSIVSLVEKGQLRNEFVWERHVEFVCDVCGGTVLRIQTYGT